MPALLAIDYPIFNVDNIGIPKDQRCRLEVKRVVLLLVGKILLLIPLEAHYVIHNV